MGTTATGATTSSGTIALAATRVNGTSGASNSVYLVQPCRRGEHRDSIAQADLPAAVSSYISFNYSGATFTKAFVLKNRSSAVSGYVVVIAYNGNPGPAIRQHRRGRMRYALMHLRTMSQNHPAFR